MKKVFGGLFCLALVVLLLAVMPRGAYALEEIAGGACGENLAWMLTEDGTLTVSGSGDMEDYSDSNSVPWLYSRSEITAIIIQEGVTGIGDYAFSRCNYVISVTIPQSVVRIGNYAFSDCSSLTEINIPKGVTSIGAYAFHDCTGLTSATIPEGVTGIGEWAFYNCYKLSGITIPKGITRIEDCTFAFCASLVEIVIPEGVTSIGADAFQWCTGLTNAVIPKGVTSIGDGVFYRCTRLTEIVLPEGVTSIGYAAFSQCHALATVTIPDSVTSMGISVFVACKSLTSVTIPEGVTDIGDSTFANCTSLSSITLPKGVVSIGDYAFSGCASLTGIDLPEGLTSIGESAFYECDALTGITIPEGVTEIGEYAFCRCYQLTEVTMLGSITSIGKYAFDSCTGLTDITLPEGVTEIGADAFKSCTSLTSITLPESLSRIYDYAFFWCDSLTDVYYGGTEAQRAEISVGMGNDLLTEAVWHYTEPQMYFVASGACGENLTWGLAEDGTLTISGSGDMENYWDGGPWWDYRNQITSVVLNEGVTYIGEDAFLDCNSLTEVVISESVTGIGERAFGGCDNLRSVTILGNITRIAPNTFASCASLSHIVIPDSVTHIGDGAFGYCGSLTSMIIPGSVTSIGAWAFNHCPIDCVLYEGTVDGIAVDQSNDGLLSAKWHYVVNKGEMYLCGECGAHFRLDGTAMAHSYQNGVCTLCGDVYFPDVNAKEWYYPGVKFAVSKGYFSGYQSGNFGPNNKITRQDFVVVLARIAKVDLKKYAGRTGFPDVKAGDYYEAAVKWASSQGIVNGYKNGNFGVGDQITREQMVTILYNFARKNGYDVSVPESAAAKLSKYTDAYKITGYAKPAVIWALHKGVISGMTATTIAPQNTASRAQTATILMNISKKGIMPI